MGSLQVRCSVVVGKNTRITGKRLYTSGKKCPANPKKTTMCFEPAKLCEAGQRDIGVVA